MKLKIVSDGTMRGSKILDAETGADLSGLCVTEILWHLGGGGVEPHSRITCLNPQLESVVTFRPGATWVLETERPPDDIARLAAVVIELGEEVRKLAREVDQLQYALRGRPAL